MTIQETKPFGIPKSLLGQPVPDVLVRLSGLMATGDDPNLHLSHIIVIANRMEGVWYVCTIHPSVQIKSPDDTLGTCLELDDIEADELLRRVEAWIRDSESVEFVPGPLVPRSTEDPDNIEGHILVRAGEAQ